MPNPQPTLYAVLGVKPSARHHEIGLAYNRLVAARHREDAPPDRKADARLREAFEVLSDLDRRATYDKQLAAARLKPAFGAGQATLAAVVVVALAGTLYYFTIKRPADAAARVVGRTPAEIAAAATSAVGRLFATDMSGQSRPMGLAFAIEPGVMVASCDSVTPNSQLAVNLNSRQVPARVTMTDESLGLCKLEVDGAGTWPLSVSSAEARVGDVVYGASMNAVGEVVLKEGRVQRVVPAVRGKNIESTVPANPEAAGAPLLDVYGRVIAVATRTDGTQRHVVIPAGWTDAPRPTGAPAPSAPASAAPVAAPDAAAPAVQPAPAMPNAPGSFTPERAERLQKAFRPPPNIPADQDP